MFYFLNISFQIFKKKNFQLDDFDDLHLCLKITLLRK